MKSLSYTLAVLLPLASQLVVAMPGAEPDVGYLEERNKGSDWGYKNHHGDDDHHEYDNQNVCEVKYPYPYYKYPCDSSPSNGTSILGATFTSFCKYQNADSGIWYSAPKGWVKEDDKPRKCRM
ncbi:unnamed protein product [Penicillium salamii]|uniref:Uncharacterized protein n=1 Tax=Penicillium salamii TaxID=1612424 RepID=A0A9W4INZ3_9EURO|nr:unnamed protein product [Penicillium salamii]CAG8007311.1 unnamed protein product [Penicillium salamii]CAG8054544.1 unnamed protein product [Penicillium salamii]CAG8270255.1 unnamed protein product [Penicillium salamii]CAG8290876.1 unnamed protein product [Penicillium salamii]